MDYRYSKKTSKKPIAAIIIIIVVLIAAAVGVYIYFSMNGTNENSEKPNDASTLTSETTLTYQTDAVYSDASSQPQSETQDNNDSGDSQSAEETISEHNQVVVPTKGSGEISYFNATYVPYKAVDTITDSECSLREVFGSSFSNGVLTFNSDGTFTDSVISASSNYGEYAVEGTEISATYSNDKNMQIKALGWDGDTPTELVINYGGYDVYFNM